MFPELRTIFIAFKAVKANGSSLFLLSYFDVEVMVPQKLPALATRVG